MDDRVPHLDFMLRNARLSVRIVLANIRLNNGTLVKVDGISVKTDAIANHTQSVKNWLQQINTIVIAG